MLPALRRDLDLSYDDALARVPACLKAEGFGVLTEIDIAATLQAKLGVAFRRYKILGACHPPSALRALTADLAVGVMLPCNVVVHERDGGGSTVLAIDPTQTLAADHPDLAELAADVRARLARAVAAI